MLCSDVMNRHVYLRGMEDTAESCARLMRDAGIGLVPIVDGFGRVVGVVTDRDLATRVIAEARPADVPLREVMTRQPLSYCRPEDDLALLEARMANSRKSRMLVLNPKGECVGIVSLSDIAHADSVTAAGRVLADVTSREVVAIHRPH